MTATTSAKPALKVLHVIPSLDPRGGGPAAMLMGLSSAQVKAGLEVTVFSCWTDQEPAVAQRLRAQGVHVVQIGPVHGRLGRHPDMKRTLAPLIAHADAVHTHGIWEEVVHQAASLSRQAGKPYIMQACGMLDPWALAQGRLHKRVVLAWRVRRDLNHAAAIHVDSEGEKKLTALEKFRPPLVVIPGGVQAGEFTNLPARGTFRQQHPELGNRPVVLFLGRIFPGKGLEYLVPAMMHVTTPDAMLVVAGPDSRGFRATVEQQVDQCGVRHKVLFTGMLEGMERIAALRDADILALPSDHENFGLSVIEALAAGTPVVVSDQVQLHEEVAREGVGGVVSREPVALARELSRWLSDSKLCQAAGAKARALAMEKYNWDRIAETTVELYQQMVQQMPQALH